jgi:hypothetical protein
MHIRFQSVVNLLQLALCARLNVRVRSQALLKMSGSVALARIYHPAAMYETVYGNCTNLE